MANVRNYEEYRAEVLERLGDDYTVEDLRNTERWRLRVLDTLSGGGSGGGGESDFTKVNLTLEVRKNEKFGNYRITPTDMDNNATSLRVGTTEGEPRYFDIDSFTVAVDYNSPVTEEIYLYQNNYFIVTEPSVHQLADFVVTGNAEAVEVEIEGNTARLVKVYGDCTISVVGSK